MEETTKPDLSGMSFDEYAEEYLRQQTRIRRGMDCLQGLIPRPPALFEGLMPERTITMISSEPGIGKTFFTLAMCHCLDQGKPLLGKFKAREKQRVFFLGQDAPDWDYDEQFRKLARGMDIHETEVDFLTNGGGSFTDRSFLLELQKWHDMVGYRTIIFDTLASFHELDEKDPRQMGGIMAILKRLRDQLGCSVIFTHHVRKPSDTPMSGNYSARGSTVIPGSVDFHISLRRAGGRVLMEMAKGRGSEKLDLLAGFIIEESDIKEGPVVNLAYRCGPL
jgi:AAA domain-containing protein